MPIHKLEWTADHCGWAVWKITESEAALQALVQPERCPDDVHSSSKRLEWLAARALLRSMLADAGLAYAGLKKDLYGKPLLDGLPNPISLSHSYPYVAVQIDTHTEVGIDVEQPKPKLIRVAHRVFSRGEQRDAGQDVVKNCIYWCAKEALYKVHGRRGLTFAKHLSIQPFVTGRTGELTGKISVDGTDRLITLEYAIEDDFVLVHTKPQ